MSKQTARLSALCNARLAVLGRVGAAVFFPLMLLRASGHEGKKKEV